MRTENVRKLGSQIREHQSRLFQLSDKEMQKTLGSGLWSGKEILGHLIDSAVMNRQRIIRSQYEEMYDFPFYDQAQWVHIQAYLRGRTFSSSDRLVGKPNIDVLTKWNKCAILDIRNQV